MVRETQWSRRVGRHEAVDPTRRWDNDSPGNDKSMGLPKVRKAQRHGVCHTIKGGHPGTQPWIRKRRFRGHKGHQPASLKDHAATDPAKAWAWLLYTSDVADKNRRVKLIFADMST